MNRKVYLLIYSLLIVFLFPALSQQHIDPSNGLVLENDLVRFEFEPNGMGLTAMIDRSSKHNHIQKVDGKHLLWEVVFARGKQIYTITNNYKSCSQISLDQLPGGMQRAVMEWNNLRWWNEDEMVSVKVIIELRANDGIANWRIAVENNSDYWGLWSVLYPIVNGFPESGKYDIARPSFGRGGELLPSWDKKIRARYPGGNWPMQFMSFQRDSNAVYLASMDSEARAKDFIAEPLQGLSDERYPVLSGGRKHRSYEPEPGERIYIEHYPDNMGVQGSDYPDYYPVAFGVYQGGWLEAAQRYRPWALQQKWISKGPVSKRSDIPESILNLGIWVRDRWVWNKAKGTPHQMNVPILEAVERLDVPVGLHWYWWHQNKFDNLYPHFFPARPGFNERTRELLKNKILVMPYINGSSADMNIDDFEEFYPHAVKDEAGGLRLHYYSKRSGRLLSMCGNQVFWHEQIGNLVEKMRNEVCVNGIYVDQVSALYHELCFDPSHGHPLGGGSYWTDGNRDMMNKIKKIAQQENGDMVVTSECATEVFFDQLDGNLLWAQPSEREIPMMSVVYSGYTIFFGSPCDYKKSDNFFRYAQGQALIDGRQNGWMDLGLFKPEYAAKVDFLNKCGQYRIAALKYLLYGQLIKPVTPAGDPVTFSDEGLGKVPSAEARLWRAEDGNLAVILVNYVDQETEFSYSLDPAEYGMQSGNYKVRQIYPEGVNKIHKGKGRLERTENLQPVEIRLIEISPIH